MRIAVFGAGGFVGGWICEALAEKKDITQVACVRKWASAVRLARRGIPIRQIDLEETAALPDVLAGFDVVVNAAMLPPAREPTLVAALHAACVKAGVRRFIQLSSAAVYGFRDGEVVETMDPAPVNEYSRGKVAMERNLMSVAMLSQSEVFILRPSIVYGPFSSAWTVRYVQRIVQGKWRSLGALGAGTCNLVHGYDVARAVIAASTADVPPGAHVLNLNGPDVVTWNEYIERLGDAIGLPGRIVPSATVFRGMAVASEIMRTGAKVTLVKSAFRKSAGAARAAMKSAQAMTQLYPTLFELKLLGRKVHYSAERAARVLGCTSTIPLETGIRQSINWCRTHGVV